MAAPYSVLSPLCKKKITAYVISYLGVTSETDEIIDVFTSVYEILACIIKMIKHGNISNVLS